MAGRKPRQPPAGAGGELRPPSTVRRGRAAASPDSLAGSTAAGRPGPEAPGQEPAASSAGPRSAANSSKVQLLPSEGAQIHELWPGAAAAGAGAPGKAGADGAPGNIGASRDWEPAAAPSARSVGSRGTAAAGKQSGPADGIKESAAEASILAFPEPPVRRRRRYVLIGTGVSAALLAALFAVLFFSPALEVKNLQVQGNSLLTVEEAEAALAPLLGTPLTLISDADAGELLAARPEVEKVEVAAVPPSDLLVTITERVPVAVLQNGREFLLIDEDGRQLKAVGERGAAALPLIDGGADAVNSEVFSTVTAVLAALPQGVLAQLDHASAETLDSVELKLANGQTVFWGSSDANAAKAKALEALLLVPATDPPVQVFDVSTPNRPVTR